MMSRYPSFYIDGFLWCFVTGFLICLQKFHKKSRVVFTLKKATELGVFHKAGFIYRKINLVVRCNN